MLETDDVQYLLSPQGRTECARTLAIQGDELPKLKYLRSRCSARQASAILTTLRLRKKAAAKFDNAAEMLFTEEGLQQATTQVVAEYRARAFAGGTVIDATCGIGGDTIALARVCSKVIAVDVNPVHMAMARHNVEVHGLAGKVEFHLMDAAAVDFNADAIFIDPSRRVEGRRKIALEDSRPPLDVVMRLIRTFKRGAVKCAPAVDYENAPPDAAVEVISLNGECKEVVLWFGFGRHRPGIQATVLPQEEHLAGGGAHPAEVKPPGLFIVDPDPAVVRAHLIDSLADMLGYWKIDATTAYISGDEFTETAFGQCRRIITWLPFNLKKLNAALRELSVGSVEIRRRGFPLPPVELKKKLKVTAGGQRAILYCSRHAGRHIVIIGEG